MIYRFGKFENTDQVSPELALSLTREAKVLREAMASVPISKIIRILGQVGKLWLQGSTAYNEAYQALKTEGAFSDEMIKASLELVPSILSEEGLRQRVQAELGGLDFLDHFSRRADFDGRVRFVPHGVLLHVAAGNIFLGTLDSIIMGYLSKNVSIVKMSSRNQTVPLIFARTLIEADRSGEVARFLALVGWKGGDASVEDAFKSNVDAVLAWGGEEMALAYGRGLAEGAKLILHGPKFSFQVLFPEALKQMGFDAVSRRVADDVVIWDQAACASPQNLFFHEEIEVSALLEALQRAFQEVRLPRVGLSADEEVEILKERSRAQYSTLLQGGDFREGKDWLVHFDPSAGARLSPLNRTLILKRFKNLQDLKTQLSPIRSRLQSCGYLAEEPQKNELLNSLAEFGVQRFAPIGSMLEGMNGAPHDGQFSLTELGRWVGDESREDTLSFIRHVVKQVPFYREAYADKAIATFRDLIPLKSIDYPLPQDLRNSAGGHVFASGGTTGKPKFVYFSREEFHEVSRMLAKGFKAQGLVAGDLCVNLFVAGNLWSSFMAVDGALMECGANVLPVGGLADTQMVLDTLERFRPRAVFGLPSLLVGVASAGLEQRRPIQVPLVFFAGEHMTAQAKILLEKAWGVERVSSAGYASVDAGPIGYQCAYSGPGEHHLYEDQVHLEIIEGEGVVTSLVRKVMPVVHLRTGDRIEWIEASPPCVCGSTDRRFVLMGRIDGQINVWSCRVKLEEIENAFIESRVDAPLYQVTVSERAIENRWIEEIQVRFETDSKPESEGIWALKKRFYSNSKDLSSTHPFEYVSERLSFEAVERGHLPRLPRTGKIRQVVDLRSVR